MAWKSNSIKRESASGRFVETSVARTLTKHEGAMKTVVEQARKLSKDRQETLDGIRDPKLRESAAR
jgi:hypothetical protein